MIIQTITFQHTLPHLIRVIIDTISLLYHVFTIDHQDNWSLLHDCQIHCVANQLGITVPMRNAHIFDNHSLVSSFSPFFFSFSFQAQLYVYIQTGTHAHTHARRRQLTVLRWGYTYDTLFFSQLLFWCIWANPMVTRRRICHGEGISLSYA